MNPAKMDTLDEHPSEAGLEVHPVVQLLIARMESHPEEFYKFKPGSLSFRAGQRIAQSNTTNPVQATANTIVENNKSIWNRKEKRLYNLALRKVRLQEAHEHLMQAILADK